MAAAQAKSLWIRIAGAFVVTVVGFGIHRFTIARIAAWQPGYPGIVELGTFTPPALMHQLHRIGPVLLVAAFVAFAIGAFRRRQFSTANRRGIILLRSAGLALLGLLVLYSWALLWVVRVSRYIRR